MSDSAEEFGNLCSDLEAAAVEGRRALTELLLSLATPALEEAGFDAAQIPRFALLDPRMFLLGSASSSSLVSPSQILYFRTLSDGRPEAIQARTDQTGILTLPGLGSFETGYPNGELSIGLNPDAVLSVTGPGGETVTLTERDGVLQTGPLEITDPRDCYVAHFLDLHVPEELALVDDAEPFAREAATVLGLLRDAIPSFYAALLANVREAVPFCHPSLESFTAFAFHGTIFINIETAGNSVPRLLADVAHQCAHVVLSAATLERSSYFVVDPDAQYEAHPAGGRSIYDTLHGLFTATVEHAALLAAAPLLRDLADEESELRPMIAHLRRIFERDYEGLIATGLLSADGDLLVHRFARCFTSPG